jgi:dihydrofolate reductase
MGRLLGGSYELLLGRRTYEIFAAYWPHNGEHPIGETFNAIRKHVVTSSDRPLTWNNSERLVGDPVEAVARLKETEGPDLLIQGSSMLYHALLPAGLVDRLALITFPVMLGRGKRWYAGHPAAARSWSLVEQARSPKGVHFASYARDGEIITGTFATAPSEDELAPPAAGGRQPVTLLERCIENPGKSPPLPSHQRCRGCHQIYRRQLQVARYLLGGFINF